jgi:hypothetical protein
VVSKQNCCVAYIFCFEGMLEKIVGNGRDEFAKGGIKPANYRERRKLAEETRRGTKQPRYGRCLEKGRITTTYGK